MYGIPDSLSSSPSSSNKSFRSAPDITMDQHHQAASAHQHQAASHQHQAASQQAHDHMQEAQVTVSVPELMQWMRDNGGAGTPAIAHKSAKGPDTMVFSAAGARVAEDLELFRTSLSLKFDAESDRYPLPKNRVTYAFSRLEGKAATMCMVGLQEGRYRDWTDVIQELEGAFGELDPAFARDRRLLSLRQNGRSFVEHANEFRALL